MSVTNFKGKKALVEEMVLNAKLSFTKEDTFLLRALIDAYFRKKKHFVNSKTEYMAGSILWIYSSINFLFEADPSWSQKNIAEILGITPKSISRTSTSMRRSLDIYYFDERFSRKDVLAKNPLNDFSVSKEGFILLKDNSDLK